MASEPTAIFVYGTLQRGQCREHSWPVRAREVRRGYVRACLYDLGPYPAITSGTDWVRGEFWRLRPAVIRPTLDVLDQIEGYVPGGSRNLYERLVVSVHSEPRVSSPWMERAYAYFMLESRLPGNARRMTATGCAYWPPAPPDVTSASPDSTGSSAIS